MSWSHWQKELRKQIKTVCPKLRLLTDRRNQTEIIQKNVLLKLQYKYDLAASTTHANTSRLQKEAVAVFTSWLPTLKFKSHKWLIWYRWTLPHLSNTRYTLLMRADKGFSFDLHRRVWKPNTNFGPRLPQFNYWIGNSASQDSFWWHPDKVDWYSGSLPRWSGMSH